MHVFLVKICILVALSRFGGPGTLPEPSIFLREYLCLRHGATRALRKHGNVHISMIPMFFLLFYRKLQYFSNPDVVSPKSCDFKFSGPPRSRKTLIPIGKPSLGEGCKFTDKVKSNHFHGFS